MRQALVAFLIALAADAHAASDTLAHARNGRWGLGVSGGLLQFRIPELRIEPQALFFTGGASLRWDMTGISSLRITYAQSHRSTETYQATDENAFPHVTYDIQRDLWANDLRMDLLVRPRPWSSAGRGPYLTGGLCFRDIQQRVHLDPAPPANEYWSMYPYLFYFQGQDTKHFLELYSLWTFGLGYDRSIGPLDIFVEPCAEVYFTFEVGGGGDPISVRPRLALGIMYRFGRTAP